MLRIEVEETGTRVCLTLEGRLIGPWVDELASAVANGRPGDARLYLDLKGLRFADDRGIQLLQRFLGEGVTLSGASPFIRELLNPRFE